MSAPATAFDLILDAIVAVMRSVTEVSGDVEADVFEDDPLPETSVDGVRVNMETSAPQQLGGMFGNPVDWVTVVRVHYLARSSGSSARPVANRLLLAGYAKLAVDPSLGLPSEYGVHIGEPQIDWATDVAATRLARASATYQIMHRTSSLTLE